uniref:Uncharacterized protein n=1 Tax=viral metagenome TaxID=1070528 RepID=A0A6C0CCZ3_9ZZZZ
MLDNKYKFTFGIPYEYGGRFNTKIYICICHINGNNVRLLTRNNKNIDVKKVHDETN